MGGKFEERAPVAFLRRQHRGEAKGEVQRWGTAWRREGGGRLGAWWSGDRGQ
jgi:hypothetical protein